MAFGNKPFYVQTKAGAKLLSGNLSFFQQGTDGKLYYLEIGQRFTIEPLPVATIFPNDRIGAMEQERRSKPLPGGWKSAPINKFNLARPPSPKSGTQTYLIQPQGIGQTPGGSVYRMANYTYYVVRKIPLDAYQKEIWLTRKFQLEQLKSDEATRKLLKNVSELLDATGTILTYAALLMPAAAIGAITLKTLVLVEEGLALTTRFIQSTHGDERAFLELEESVCDKVFDNAAVLLPTWSGVICKVGMSGYFYYRMQDEKTLPPLGSRVAADDILEQIYRFRCVADPTLSGQLKMLADAAAHPR